ncbi:MAG: hypothetical protein ACOVQX_06675 [Legionella sp.]
MIIRLGKREFTPENYFFNRKNASEKIIKITEDIRNLENNALNQVLTKSTIKKILNKLTIQLSDNDIDALANKTPNHLLDKLREFEPKKLMSLKELNQFERKNKQALTSRKKYYDDYIPEHERALAEYQSNLLKLSTNIDFEVPFYEYASNQQKLRELRQELNDTQSFLNELSLEEIVLNANDENVGGGAFGVSTTVTEHLCGQHTLNVAYPFYAQICQVVSTFNQINSLCEEFLTNPYISKNESEWLKRCILVINDRNLSLQTRFDNLANEINMFRPESTISYKFKNFFSYLINFTKSIFNLEKRELHYNFFSQSSNKRHALFKLTKDNANNFLEAQYKNLIEELEDYNKNHKP